MSTPTVTVVLSNTAVPGGPNVPTATTPLIPDQTNAVMQNVAMDALGIDPGLLGELAYQMVRVGWQTAGAPAWKIEEDICFVRSTGEDDEYNRVRDEAIVPNPADDTGDTVLDMIGYTRVWRVFWTFYGPKSFDRARIVKSALLKPTQSIHDLLVAANLYVVPDIPEPTFLKELKNEEWWSRTDFECLFNEQVTEQEVVNTIGSAEVSIATSGSQEFSQDGYDTGGFDENDFGS